MTAILHMLDGSIRVHKVYGRFQPQEMTIDAVRFVWIRDSKFEYRETKEKRK